MERKLEDDPPVRCMVVSRVVRGVHRDEGRFPTEREPGWPEPKLLMQPWFTLTLDLF
jgi:hypothetical protein